MLTHQQIINRLHEVFVLNNAPQSLSSEGNCIYSHQPNGFGCGIGCLISSEDAEVFDTIVIDNGGADIMNISGMGDDNIVQIFDKYFSQIKLGFLELCQTWHDYKLCEFDSREKWLSELIEKANFEYDLFLVYPTLSNVIDENGYISIAKFSGKPVVDVKGYFSNKLGVPTFKVIKLIFADGSFIYFEGEHDHPYLVNDESISYKRYEQLRDETNEN